MSQILHQTASQTCTLHMSVHRGIARGTECKYVLHSGSREKAFHFQPWTLCTPFRNSVWGRVSLSLDWQWHNSVEMTLLGLPACTLIVWKDFQNHAKQMAAHSFQLRTRLGMWQQWVKAAVWHSLGSTSVHSTPVDTAHPLLPQDSSKHNKCCLPLQGALLDPMNVCLGKSFPATPVLT